jgi:hypothetical protein
MTRIVGSPFLVEVGAERPADLDRSTLGSTYTSNEVRPDRQRDRIYFGVGLRVGGSVSVRLAHRTQEGSRISAEWDGISG